MDYGIILLNTSNKSKIQPLHSFYMRIIRYLLGALYSTPLKWLLYLANMSNLTEYIITKKAAYWHHLLHLASNNPLYSLCRNDWFYIWKYHRNPKGDDVHRFKPYRCRSPASYKRTILWDCFVAALNYHLPSLLCFNHTTDYHDFYTVYNYNHLSLNIPSILTILDEPYDEHNLYNMNRNTLFIFITFSKLTIN